MRRVTYFVGFYGTSWDFMGLRGTPGDSVGLQGTPGDSAGLRGTPGTPRSPGVRYFPLDKISTYLFH